ncbi:MAG: MarR family transcriptional regulator [Streptosporangiales bacterium]|nr:MarR family transcriptional regulator [Streptosporangiales bacterium]
MGGRGRPEVVERWEQALVLWARVDHALAAALHTRHGLGLSEYRALSRLADSANGELRMQELADAIGLNQSSVSRLVARLEGAGLSRRDLCPDDKRGVYTVITAEGRRGLTAAMPTYERALTAALDEIAADRQLAPLIRVLRS